MNSVRYYRGRITDPALAAQIAGFLGQEATHAKLHDAFNQAAAAQGYPVEKLDRNLRKLRLFIERTLPHKAQLAVTVAFEHYTAILAELLLSNERVREPFEAETLKLWIWHALEESEHKTVAWDVLQAVGGSYTLRVSTMFLVSIVFFGLVASGHISLLIADGQLFRARQNTGGLNHMFGRKGVLTGLIGRYLDFYKPSFHPTQHASDALLRVWRERLFGADGLLVEHVRS
jgi:predicted metal-dependent hydrolase